MNSVVSIVVCTRNRAADIRETLQSLSEIDCPQEFSVEILVIDNGSTDDTQAVLQELGIRSFVAPIPGVARARNAGIANATGDPVVFVDDDLRFPKDWLVDILAEFERGADAVAGAIRLAPHLLRPWMTAKHREMLGSTELYDETGEVGLHGGAMAFRKRVFERVPTFDEELGVGAIGSSEEQLFAHQLQEAGFYIAANKSPVEHHCSPDLLKHENLVRRSFNVGKSQAYIDYHWRHDENIISRAKTLRIWLGFLKRKFFSKKGRENHVEAFEVDYHVGRGYRTQLSVEVIRPRNYEKRGLCKLKRG